MILLYILFTVYLLAVNFYAFLLLKKQRDEEQENMPKKSGDGKLFIAGLLGGAIAIYIAMFIFKYRLNSLFLMLVMPVLGVLNVYLCVIAFRSGFTFIAV